MRQAYLIVGLLMGVILAVFALQNSGPVEVRFLFLQTQGPLAGVILASALAGIVLAAVFAVPEILRLRWNLRTIEKRQQAPPRSGPPGEDRGPHGGTAAGP